MKVTMQLTLDGLVRAMRAKAHELADTVESGAHARDRDLPDADPRSPRRDGDTRGAEDDRRHA